MATTVHSLVTSTDPDVDDHNKSDPGHRDTASTSQNSVLKAQTQSASKAPKFRSKYRHVEALHKVSRPSVLSHDSQQAPSFLGFRNLMVLTISESTCP